MFIESCGIISFTFTKQQFQVSRQFNYDTQNIFVYVCMYKINVEIKAEESGISALNSSNYKIKLPKKSIFSFYSERKGIDSNTFLVYTKKIPSSQTMKK